MITFLTVLSTSTIVLVSLYPLMKIQRITYLSLGSNQGNKLENLQNAINLIADRVGAVQKIASIYKTASWGYDGEDFTILVFEFPPIISRMF